MLLSNALFIDTDFRKDCLSKINYINLITDEAVNNICNSPENSNGKTLQQISTNIYKVIDYPNL